MKRILAGALLVLLHATSSWSFNDPDGPHVLGGNTMQGSEWTITMRGGDTNPTPGLSVGGICNISFYGTTSLEVWEVPFRDSPTSDGNLETTIVATTTTVYTFTPSQRWIRVEPTGSPVNGDQMTIQCSYAQMAASEAVTLGGAFGARIGSTNTASVGVTAVQLDTAWGDLVDPGSEWAVQDTHGVCYSGDGLSDVNLNMGVSLLKTSAGSQGIILTMATKSSADLATDGVFDSTDTVGEPFIVTLGGANLFEAGFLSYVGDIATDDCFGVVASTFGTTETVRISGGQLALVGGGGGGSSDNLGDHQATQTLVMGTNSITLGGSATVDGRDVADDGAALDAHVLHDPIPGQEAIEDIVGAMVTDGANTGATYDDGAGTITFDSYDQTFYATEYASGSNTGGIQEAYQACTDSFVAGTGGGLVQLPAGQTAINGALFTGKALDFFEVPRQDDEVPAVPTAPCAIRGYGSAGTGQTSSGGMHEGSTIRCQSMSSMTATNGYKVCVAFHATSQKFSDFHVHTEATDSSSVAILIGADEVGGYGDGATGTSNVRGNNIVLRATGELAYGLLAFGVQKSAFADWYISGFDTAWTYGSTTVPTDGRSNANTHTGMTLRGGNVGLYIGNVGASSSFWYGPIIEGNDEYGVFVDTDSWVNLQIFGAHFETAAGGANIYMHSDEAAIRMFGGRLGGGADYDVVRDVAQVDEGPGDTDERTGPDVFYNVLFHNGANVTAGDVYAVNHTRLAGSSGAMTGVTIIDLADVGSTVGPDHIDALSEIHVDIKTAPNDTSDLVVGTAGATDDCAKWDATGNLVSAGDACNTPGAIGDDDLNVLTQISQAIKTAPNDTNRLVVGTAGATDDCAKWDATGNLVSQGAPCGAGGGDLAADDINDLAFIDQTIKSAANDTNPLIVGVAGTTDHCAKWDANGNLVSAGAVCGTGGNVSGDIIFDALGDLVVGSGSDAAARLPIGAANAVLVSDGSTASWDTTPTVDGVDQAPVANPYLTLVDSDTSGRGGLVLSDAAGPDSVLGLQAESNGSLETFALVDGINGRVQIGGDVSSGGVGDGVLALLDENGGTDNAVLFQAPDGLAAFYTLTMPPDDGDADQVLKTNGSGVLDWVDPATGTEAATYVAVGSTTPQVDLATAEAAGVLPDTKGGTGVTSLGTNVATSLGVNRSATGGFPAIIAQGFLVLNPGPITANTCAAESQPTALGATFQDIIDWTPQTNIQLADGYGVGASGDGLVIYTWTSTDTAHIQVCNATAASITPGSITINWRILR